MATIDNLSAYRSGSQIRTDALFADVRKLLWSTCYEFTGRYGGDAEEWFSIASVKFCEVVQTFDESKASFSYWLRKKVWNHLLDCRKVELHRLKILPRESGEALEQYSVDCSGSYRSFKSELSNDAQAVLNLMTNGKCDSVTSVVNQIKNYKLPSASLRVRKAIEMELVGTWDWTRERVRSAFVEISCALT